MILVIHFNAFTGKLEGGYLMHAASKRKVGGPMTPGTVLAYLADNPNQKCAPLKV